MNLDFEGFRFVVTGGASGIGHAIATAALQRGALVTVLDLDPSTAPAGAIAQRADVADDGSIAEAVQRAAEAMGGIDVVVNNAGIGAQGTVETNPLDEWRKVFEVNVFGMVRVDARCAPASATVVARLGCQHMFDRGYGRPTRSGPVQRQQGRSFVADAGDGRRPSA